MKLMYRVLFEKSTQIPLMLWECDFSAMCEFFLKKEKPEISPISYSLYSVHYKVKEHDSGLPASSREV